MRLRALAPFALALLAALSGATPARAALFELSASLRVGAATGTGIGGAQQDRDFFAGARGATYCARAGLEVLWLRVTLEHDQFTDFSTVTGTWTQLMVGPHFAFPLNEAPPGERPSLYADLGVAVGAGIGTGRQIVPPLDNAQISDRGLMLELQLGIEKRFGRFFGVGISLPLAWGYLVKNDVPANDTSSWYQSFHGMLLGTLTVHIGL